MIVYVLTRGITLGLCRTCSCLRVRVATGRRRPGVWWRLQTSTHPSAIDDTHYLMTNPLSGDRLLVQPHVPCGVSGEK